MIGNVLAKCKCTVSVQVRKHLNIVKVVRYNLYMCLELIGIAGCPPVSKVSFLVKLTALVIKSVSHLMTYHYTYGTVVECVIGTHVKERILQDSGRETYLICCGIVVRINSLRSHEPLCIVNRFLVFAVYHILQKETAYGNIVLKQTLAWVNFKFGIIFPLVGITNLYIECIQLFVGTCLGAVAHPILGINTLSKSNLQVLDQGNHTLLGFSREIFLNIKLTDCLTKYAAYGRCGTFPPGLLLLTAAHNLAVKIKVGLVKLHGKPRSRVINKLPFHI